MTKTTFLGTCGHGKRCWQIDGSTSHEVGHVEHKESRCTFVELCDQPPAIEKGAKKGGAAA